jgi:outer membrane biosynthesis protein TonB
MLVKVPRPKRVNYRYLLRMDAERLIEDLSGRVRDALSQAEARAKEIVTDAEERARKLVAEAEADAKRIRARAEEEADERLAKVRDALSGLEGVFTPGAKGEVDPQPPVPPEPSPTPTPEPTPPAEPEPTPPVEPEPLPPEPEIEPPAPPQPDREPPALKADQAVNGGAEKGDEIGARIVATKMALDGSSREEIAAHLAEKYEVEDTEKLLDFVMDRAAKR